MDLSSRRPLVLARLALAAAAVMLFLVVVSAYLRLAGTGLGCEPWPECFGVGRAVRSEEDATRWLQFLARLGHRLAASTMLLLVFGILVASLRPPHRRGDVILAFAMATLTTFLALLGIFSSTVMAPAVALGNLLGGLALLACAWALRALQALPPRRNVSGPEPPASLHYAAIVAPVLLTFQIGLGGLVSVKLAAAACLTLPGCEGGLSPGEGLAALNPLASSPVPLPRDQGAVLHLAHRLGALLTLGWLGVVALGAWRHPRLRGAAAAAALLALIQVILGAAMVKLSFPLSLSLAHNALAALLLLATIELALRATRPSCAVPPA